MLEKQAPKVTEWQRLSPISILYFVVKFVVGIAKQGVQAFLPVIAIIATTGENRWLIIGLIGVIGAALIIAGALLSYLRFKYRIDQDSVLIQSGVITRKRLSVNFDRIQNVAFKEPLYFRPFSLVVMAIESAGSSSEEVSLAGIDRKQAEIIRETVLSKRTSKASSAVQDTDAETEETKNTTLIKQPVDELIRYGLSNNNIWVFAGIAVGALAQIDFESFAFNPFPEEMINSLSESSKAVIGFLLLVLALIIVLLLMLASVLGAIIVYYNFHLTEEGEQLHRTKGLFERQETSLKLSKVQSVVLDKPWPALLLNRYHISLKQVGFDMNTGMPSGTKFIIPSVTSAFTQSFAKHLYGSFSWADADMAPVDKAYSYKYFFLVYAPICIVLIAGIAYLSGVKTFMLLGVLPLLWLAIELRRRRFGYYSDGEHAVVRTGFIGHRLTVFSFYKVQSVSVTQSPGQRRRELANLHIRLASSTISIPYIPLVTAQNWRDTILLRIETTKKHWM